MNVSGHEIVERIDSLLKQKHLKRLSLAEKIGVSTNTISAWSVRGTVPDADVAIKIADFFCVSVEWLITGHEKETSTADELLLKKYHSLDESGKYAVDSVLNAMYEKSEDSKKQNLQS
jgi:transcriptional regulator with XRE-family HTH domain